MSILNEFITNYGSTILYTILTAIAGYLGIVVKNLYTKFINDKTKKDVVKPASRRLSRFMLTFTARKSSTSALSP